MDNLFTDQVKINEFKQIQYNLLDLSPNSGEDEINNVINEIPQNILNDKDDLMMVCQLFATYARTCHRSKEGNAIKLFEKIMIPIKTHLADESSFFWNIFGSFSCFLFWMYEEGLIKIETIISSSQKKDSLKSTEYFLPEIIEKEPELFEKEIKYKFDPIIYSKSHIDEFKELRKKYFKWLRNSNDFNDPFYKEIEKDQLRLSIKTDDIDTFQSIISKTNMDVNSIIDESILDNFDNAMFKMTLIGYAIECDSIKIFKYLLMKNAKLGLRDVFRSIRQRNLDIIHMVESYNNENFKKIAFFCAISCWYDEIIEYSLTNYPINYLNADDNYEFTESDERDLNNMISNVCFVGNFIFFDSYLLPFFRKHNNYVEEKIYDIISDSFIDSSCYFLKEFLKYPGIDINRSFSKERTTLLISAIRGKNVKATEILLNTPNIDINFFGGQYFTPFQLACRMNFDMKVIKLFCSFPNLDMSCNQLDVNQICITNGNFYALQYLIENYQDFKLGFLSNLFRLCISDHHFFIIKILLKYKLRSATKKEIIEYFKNSLIIINNQDILNIIIKILDEL